MVASIIYFPAQMKTLIKSNLILVSDYFHRGILQCPDFMTSIPHPFYFSPISKLILLFVLPLV